MVRAVYPGTFDPVHNGHVDIVTRAAKLFDRLLVGVYDSPSKQVLFSTEDRVDLFNKSVGHLGNVDVVPFNGLVTAFAQDAGARYVVRGLRAGFDFESEFEMALMNRRLAPDVDVVCLMTDLHYQFVRASLIKEVARLGGDINGLAPPNVIAALKAKFGD